MLVILAACIISITGCRKNQDSVKDQGSAVLTAEGLSKDAPFIKLNDAISRFDPTYLVMVYKDTRTIKEIIEKSNDLLVQLKTDPESAPFQKQLADFYHFSSVAQLKEYSIAVSENLKKLDEKYDLKKTLFVGNGSKIFYEARRMYAKYKLDNPPGVRTKTDGLWSDFVDTYFSEFDYNTYLYNEEFGQSGDGGGGDGCNGEVCCDQKEVCRLEARDNFWSNLASYGGGGAASGLVTFGALGSGIPVVGTFVGGVAGFIFGGLGGTAVAYEKYHTQLNICQAKYQLCIDSKKSKS